MNLTKQKRQTKILQLFKKVEKSGLSVKKYFKKHKTPISVIHYFRLKKRYIQEGIAALKDQRHDGNARKISAKQIELIRGMLAVQSY